jgi:hypothetical protein
MTQPGDLLLFRVGPGSPFLGKLIGWGQKVIGQAPTKAAYDHVALAGRIRGEIVEAYWPRVRVREYDPEGDPNVELYRDPNATPQQIDSIMTYAYAHKGEWYNLTGLLTFGLVQLGHSVVCSQFAWKCYMGSDYTTAGYTPAGITLCPPARLITPDDIAGSASLIKVV